MTFERFLKDLSLMVEQDERYTKQFCKIISDFEEAHTRIDFDAIGYMKSNYESMKQLKQICKKDNLEELEVSNNNLKLQLEGLEARKAQLQCELNCLESEKKNLGSKQGNIQQKKELESLKTILKCITNLFPVIFDYSTKTLKGFVYNKEKVEYHSFMLPIRNSTANAKCIFMAKKSEIKCSQPKCKMFRKKSQFL